MNIGRYRLFSEHLKSLVKDERSSFVIDKNVVITASAAIDELVTMLEQARNIHYIDQIIIDNLRSSVKSKVTKI
ncbi:hypothetical protein EGT71_09125 [Atlantibacter subterranea]|uniref:Uncharacterized protein n=1 Tax=Atlantibacter subterraneus TaxID=255519 RepID=A0A3R9F628_9ENTR|nr:hypothetical protein EGK67_10805 [Atlantibacter subterranea]RSE01969.1 hypothetical protein EGT84_20390 [Atlantibacter subterranea]RSE26582.1 hypothetical protein EGT71_09125 [Atlantibacter subterranea]